MIAASGSIYEPTNVNGTTNPIVPEIELAPSASGQLNVLAANSIYNLSIGMSGADPSMMATPFRPAFYYSGAFDFTTQTFPTVTNVSPNSANPGGFFALPVPERSLSRRGGISTRRPPPLLAPRRLLSAGY